MAGWQIRDACRQQLEQLEELERCCFSLPWTREMLESQLPGPMHIFLVAEDADGTILGYVGMMHVLDEGYISNVAVRPEARRQGVADALIRELLHRSEALALRFVTLEVRAHNEPAQALYRKHGFAPVGLRPKYYEAPVEDAVLMTKYL